MVVFNAPYALRLGASNAEIGLLSSLPALIALLVTIPAGRIFSGVRDRVRWLSWMLLLCRIGYFLAVFVPFLPGPNKGLVLVGIIMLLTLPASFFNVGWYALLPEVIPERRRASVFASRNILLSGIGTVCIFAAGWWLKKIPFPINYQLMYLFGFVTAVVEVYHISRLREAGPGSGAQAGTARRPPGLAEMRQAIRKMPADHPDFWRIVVNTLAHGTGLWLVAPLYVLYYVRGLNADEGWLGLNGTVATLTPILGYYVWQRVIARRGENQVLRWTISLLGLYPLLIGLSGSLRLILVWTALYGLLAPGMALSHFSMLLKVCPPDQRSVYMGVFITVSNLGAFLMPLLGIALAERLGLGPTLVLGGALCLLGSSLFRWRPLQTTDSVTQFKAEAAGDPVPQV